MYDEATFQQMKDDMDKAFKGQEDAYGSMKDKKLVGKDTLVEYLKTYRDALKATVDSIAETLDALS